MPRLIWARHTYNWLLQLFLLFFCNLNNTMRAIFYATPSFLYLPPLVPTAMPLL